MFLWHYCQSDIIHDIIGNVTSYDITHYITHHLPRGNDILNTNLDLTIKITFYYCHGNQCPNVLSRPIPNFPTQFRANRSVNVGQTVTQNFQFLVWLSLFVWYNLIKYGTFWINNRKALDKKFCPLVNFVASVHSKVPIVELELSPYLLPIIFSWWWGFKTRWDWDRRRYCSDWAAVWGIT